jgi:hypothetical protein
LEQNNLYQAAYGSYVINGVTMQVYTPVANAAVYGQALKVYQCPSDPSNVNGHPSGMTDGASSYACNFFAFGTATGSYPNGLGNPPYTVASWNWWGANSIPGSFADGTSNTILFTEKYARCEYPPGSTTGGGTTWVHPGTAGVASGQSWWPAVMAPDYLKYNANSLGPNAGALFQAHPTPFIGTCDWTRASTPHPSAIEVALGDGSVRSVSQGVSPALWFALFTPAGSEVIGDY